VSGRKADLPTVGAQLTILHFGPNQGIYPFFNFDSDTDPYNYRLTFVASLVIWASELGSAFLARVVIWVAYGLDVTNVGLDEFREHVSGQALLLCWDWM